VNVLVDTSVWSLALRRATEPTHQLAKELAELIREGRVMMIGSVRQELLSGVRDAKQFDALRAHLRAFPDLVLEVEDFEQAAEFYNECRAKGVQGSSVDFLICAVAARRELLILTADADFASYARVLPLRLHEPRSPGYKM
jgi:predicted nucleic acid-binding protein